MKDQRKFIIKNIGTHIEFDANVSIPIEELLNYLIESQYNGATHIDINTDMWYGDIEDYGFQAIKERQETDKEMNERINRMKEIVITIALEPTIWQRLLDRLKIKKFKYDENMIAVKSEHYLYDRPNSKIKIIKVQENPLR